MRGLHRLAFVAALVAAVGGLAACPPAATPGALTTAVPLPATDEFALGPGDQFEVRVFGEPDLSGPYRVGPDGSIDYPLIGQVQVGGRDPHQVASEIAQRLGEKFLKNPQVSVLVKEQTSKKIIVLGEVQKPGTYPYAQNMSILEAITTAGGFTPMASKGDVRLTRVENGQEILRIIDVAKITLGKERNVLLRPGDVISVTQRIL